MTRVLGLDASLVRTGVAMPDGSTDVWRPRKLRGAERLDWIAARLTAALDATQPHLVSLEGYAYGARGRAVYNIGELGGIIRWILWTRQVPLIEVPPAVLKKFATGRGNAPKEDVVVAAAKVGTVVRYDDEADAWFLRAIGRQLMDDPVVDLRMQDDLPTSVTWTRRPKRENTDGTGTTT